MALGLLPNPVTKKADVQLDQAKHAIDLLAVLQQKTEGNRTPQESDELDAVLHELRMAYVTVPGRIDSLPRSPPSTFCGKASEDKKQTSFLCREVRRTRLTSCLSWTAAICPCRFQNPQPVETLDGGEESTSALLDRLGLQTRTYRATLRDGAVFELRPRRGDWPSVNGAYLWNEYAPVGRPLSPGDKVIDVGANIGAFTILAAACRGTGGPGHRGRTGPRHFPPTRTEYRS